MLIILGMLACTTTPEPEAEVEEPSARIAKEIPRHVTLFGVVPEHMHEGDPPPAPLVDLGRMLFFDARLSADQSVSCNSCHALDRYGVSPEATSGTPVEGATARNAPSVYNAALQFRQYWDGRGEDIEHATRLALTDPQQMGEATQSSVVDAVRGLPGYREAFAAAYPGDDDPITFGAIGKALGTFQRTLVTPGSKLDLYQSGNLDALSEAQLLGFERFIDTGCVSCHAGPLVGGAMYQRLGAAKPFETEDRGVARVSGSDRDLNLFKVPSLRNVVQTGPWLHDGSVKTLPEVIRLMGDRQLGRDLGEEEVASILMFLDALTGPLPAYASEVPPLP